MNLEVPKAEIKSATRVTGGPSTPRKGPPKFKQRQTRQFKSKPPKKGIQGFGDDIPGMEGLGTDITVICPWEAFNHLELNELAKYGNLKCSDKEVVGFPLHMISTPPSPSQRLVHQCRKCKIQNLNYVKTGNQLDISDRNLLSGII
ncbi:hypothetical protein F7725_014692 [Dissostichus mawsoni]|uniref:Retinal rod rhodopsin-sensitive cGMP 3',5'-cyclic phosphodiesterase subunit gamma n=1 Tax=Dissostichus mawsoni TaxID=36200 RepID=A0A7J5YWM3_DISMA|nr:hypothetical protein F7725_014692 [Dissostichus mawsoni]